MPEYRRHPRGPRSTRQVGDRLVPQYVRSMTSPPHPAVVLAPVVTAWTASPYSCLRSGAGPEPRTPARRGHAAPDFLIREARVFDPLPPGADGGDRRPLNGFANTERDASRPLGQQCPHLR
jgi:hypothetical protein